MIRSFDAPSLAAGALLGTAGAYLVAPVALAFLSSTGWVSLGVAGAICVLAGSAYLPTRAKASPRDAFRLPPRDEDGTALESQAITPREWLRQARAFPPDPDPTRQAALIADALSDQVGDEAIGDGSVAALMALLGAFGEGKVGYPAFDRLARIMKEEPFHRDRALQDFIAAMYKAWGNDPGVTKHCSRHHHMSTQVVCLFVVARRRAPVRASDILWLKQSHRPLWYALDNAGRHACHVEGLGINAHYLAERHAREPLVKPRVTRAVQALAEYARSIDVQDRDNEESLDLYADMGFDEDVDLGEGWGMYGARA